MMMNMLLFVATLLTCWINVKSAVVVDRQHDRSIQQIQRNAIINGDAVQSAGKYPYFVNLYFIGITEDGSEEEFFYCGGSLVAPDIVLSAAHCQVYLGDLARIGRYDQDTWTEDLEVIEVRDHPDYATATLGLGFGLLDVMDNDITVLKLNASSTASIVTLNDDPDVPVGGQELVVIGFGDIDITPEGEETPDILQEVTVNDLSDEACVDYYMRYFITNDMLCAADEANIEDSCQGDSGGPLLDTKNPNPDDDVQVGVVSWGRGCAVEGYPGVYAKVSYHFNFIHAQIMDMSDDPPPYLASRPVEDWEEPTRYGWLNPANWRNPFSGSEPDYLASRPRPKSSMVQDRSLITKAGSWIGGGILVTLMSLFIVGLVWSKKASKKADYTPIDNATTIVNETTSLM